MKNSPVELPFLFYISNCCVEHKEPEGFLTFLWVADRLFLDKLLLFTAIVAVKSGLQVDPFRMWSMICSGVNMSTANLKLVKRKPTVDEYRRLRSDSGLSGMSEEAAQKGLPGTLFAVVLEDTPGHAMAMGRVIGDGGCFYNIVDIAVHPTYQKQGHGKSIMQALMDWLHENAPKTALVTLLADGEAYKLYEKYGFKLSAPASQGMLYRVK